MFWLWGFHITLPRCFVNAIFSYTVAASSGTAALGSSLSDTTPELNWIQLCAICLCGQSSRVIDLLGRRCLPAMWHLCSCKISSPKRQAIMKAPLVSKYWLGNDFLYSIINSGLIQVNYNYRLVTVCLLFVNGMWQNNTCVFKCTNPKGE